MPTTNEFKVDPSQRRPETRRQCPHCDYVCATNAKLKIHSIVHTNRRDFLCDKCPMAFKSKKNLAAHQRIHLSPAIKNASNRTQTCEKSKRDIGKFDLQCIKCDFVTERECALANHMMKHTDERNYACNVCPKKFKRTAYLWQHKRHYSHYLEGERRQIKTKSIEPSTIDIVWKQLKQWNYHGDSWVGRKPAPTPHEDSSVMSTLHTAIMNAPSMIYWGAIWWCIPIGVTTNVSTANGFTCNTRWPHMDGRETKIRYTIATMKRAMWY